MNAYVDFTFDLAVLAGKIRHAIESQLDVLNEHLLEFEDKHAKKTGRPALPLQDKTASINKIETQETHKVNKSRESCYQRHLPMALQEEVKTTKDPISLKVAQSNSASRANLSEIAGSHKKEKALQRRRRREERLNVAGSVASASRGPTRKEMEAKMGHMEARLKKLGNHQQKIYRQISTERLVERLETVVTDLVLAIRELRSG